MATTDRPDVLILMTDQFNPRCAGYAGDPVIHTPNIDSLAVEGVSFDCAYTVCPVCMPARGSFISGLYPHNHGFWTNFLGMEFPREEGAMFRDIRDAGYCTAHVGKSHWFNPEWGADFDDHADYYRAVGFEHFVDIPGVYMTPFHKSVYSKHLQAIGLWDAYVEDLSSRFAHGHYLVKPSPLPPDEHNDSLVGRKAIEFIEHAATDRPFCLHASFPGPHTPMDAPGEYATMHDPADVPEPPNVPDVVTCGKEEPYTRDDMRRMRANYYGKITLIDHWIGRIVDALKARGTWDNTLVVFTADHGEHMGAFGRLGKGRFNDESARIPLVVRWPGRIAPGQRTQALAELIDVYATMVDAAGGRVSSGRFGASLLPVATGHADSVHDAVFSEIASKPRYMVRTDRYKWSLEAGREHLFDMANDPFELTDLGQSKAHADLRRSMQERLGAFLASTQVDRARDYVPLFPRVRAAAGREQLETEHFVELFRRLHA